MKYINDNITTYTKCNAVIWPTTFQKHLVLEICSKLTKVKKIEMHTFFVLLACQGSEFSDWPQLDMSGRDPLRGIPSSPIPLNSLVSSSDWLERESPALRRLLPLRLLFFMLFKELFIPSTRVMHSFLRVSASQLRDSFGKTFWRKILNLESPVWNSVK